LSVFYFTERKAQVKEEKNREAAQIAFGDLDSNDDQM
jgi:hypothetical protein